MAAEDGHLLAVAAVGGTTGNLILHHTELLGQSRLQTGGVQTSQRSHLTGLQTRVEQRHQTSQVSRIEDDHHVLYVRTELLDVLTQLLGNLAVACQQVLTGHTGLTRSTTA